MIKQTVASLRLTRNCVTYEASYKQTNSTRCGQTKSHISILYTNARSVLPKKDEIMAYIATEKPDVVAITETWANSAHLESECHSPGTKASTKIERTRKEE